ncbi:hypothetical protein MBLNU457_7402t1 [Dothideomycetes sp. NU457]
MRFTTALLSLATLASTTFAWSSGHGSTSQTFSDVTIFDPPANYTIPRTLYARTLLLEDSVLLATWENYLPDNDTFPYYPIYQSYDGGRSWSERSRVYDQINDWGLRYQPFLYELSEPLGDFLPGDILIAGNSIPDDLSKTQIDVYVSRDKGYTWTFVSTVANGGEAIPDNGLTPIWEPFLMTYKGQMVCYYSDQRDPKYGQKLVHQVSSDLLTWGPVVNDVAYDTYYFRPGMTTVSALPNGQYIMTYEFYGAPQAAFAVYYRVSDSPLTFDEAEGHVVESPDGTVPVSSPYNVWTPVGGPNGTIVVSCGTLSQIFLNTELGAVGSTWTKVDTPEGTSYSRSLRVLDDPRMVLIAGGGVLGGANNSVTASVVDIRADERKAGLLGKEFWS